MAFVDWEGFMKNPRFFESRDDVGEMVRKVKEKSYVYSEGK